MSSQDHASVAGPGESIGPYVLEALLGKGGMGEVYRAYDDRLTRHVAIKCIRPGNADDTVARARLRREARAAAALTHPSIVQIFDIVERGDGDWVVMELVDGQPLDRVLTEGPLSIASAIAVGRDVADGLAAAHAKGILHRDLKSENVMLTADGRAKILDFGLAKHTGTDHAETSISIEGRVLGTCRSMSPEQAQGQSLDQRSDLFSLGVLLYEITTGVSPFRSRGVAATLMQVCSHDPPPSHALNESVPVELSRLTSRLLEKRPEARPNRAELVALELAGLIDSTSRTAAPPVQVFDPEETLAPPGSSTWAPFSTAAGSAKTPAGRLATWWRRPRVKAALGLSLATFLTVALVPDARSALRDAFAPGPRASDVKTAPGALAPAPLGGASALRTSAEATTKLRIAVLPFDGVGTEEADYLAAGLTEEITRKLATLNGLGVVSRTSAMRLAANDWTLPRIAEALDVDYVLEGTVNRPPTSTGETEGFDDGAPIRITPRLVRASDDTLLWSEAYNLPASALLGLQSQIAIAVAEQLDVTLLHDTPRGLDTVTTRVPAAYFAYLRGLDYLNRPVYNPDDLTTAENMFVRATEEDPDFAEAHAELAIVLSTIFINRDPSQQRRRRAQEALARARDLAPELSAVQRAEGLFLYRVEEDYAGAIEAFRAAAADRPPDAALLEATALVKRRQGALAEACALFERSFRLDPANAELAWVLASTLRARRRFADADRWYQVAEQLQPDTPGIPGWRALSILAWRGCVRPEDLPGSCSLREAQTILRETARTDDPHLDYFETLLGMYEASIQDEPDAQTQLVETLSQHGTDSRQSITSFRHLHFWQRVLTLRRFGDRATADAMVTERIAAIEAHLQGLGDTREQAPRGNALYQQAHLGIAHAYFDRADDALPLVRQAIAGTARDHFSGPRLREYLALVLVLLNEHEAAIDELEQLLDRQYRGAVTASELAIDPLWQPLRTSPRFQALLARTRAAEGDPTAAAESSTQAVS